MDHSIWTKHTQPPSFEHLEGEITTDVLVIGGGITGLLCAYMLGRAGVKCLLAEANTVCSGITQNTTAKITCQHGLIYDQMIRRFGYETAQRYYRAQVEAMAMYEMLAQSIPCDYEVCDSFVYAREDRKKLEREVAALQSLGCPATFADKLPLPLPTVGAVQVKDQAQFHPLKFAYGIAKDLPICEHTKVIELCPDGAVTERGKIKAGVIIVATHFPFINKHGAYFLKMYQHRSYVLAFENATEAKGMYVDGDKKGLSFRHYNGRLLLGGGSHRTGKTGGGWRELEDFAQVHYPNARILSRWATQDCMTLDDIPYIGQYSMSTPNLYVATGFNKWGMTSAMVSAMLLSDLVQGKKNDLAAVFSPSRSMMRPQLAINTAQALLGWLTPAPRCPHLGCALKYNPEEHSWDCSCHGSRFAADGKLLDNPATDDHPHLKKKKP